MTLAEGQKLGPYEIVEAAGAGGMGEIFKARDTRLDRTVAIKVLPAESTVNTDMKARFEREAKAISSLNHPNICTLYDIGNVDGVDFLVMEFLEGQTLSDRLKKGPLDLNKVYEIAIEVCDALDKAHRQGLIHRDLKPGNIMLTEEGAKLLDFGLAKFESTNAQPNEVSQITQSTPLTGVGTILGTVQYMSPEQLEGMEADARSDIFSFGVILYEMLTGLRAFAGKSQAALIAAIMGQEPPDVSEMKSSTPPGLSRLIKKCIEKNPDNRWQSAKDLADELRWVSRSGSQAGIPASVSTRRRFRMRIGWTVACVATAAALVLAGLLLTKEEPEPKMVRFEILQGNGLSDMSWPRISPDGKLLAFRASDSAGQRQIYIRPLNSLDAYPLRGTERTGRPFWSPDSKYLAYFADNQLMKMPISGGPAQVICEADGADGSWGSSGIILFDYDDIIHQVPSSGGVAVAATTINREEGETYHAWPWFLPDGNHFLYTAYTDSTSSLNFGRLVLKVGSLSGDVNKTLTSVETRVEYSTTGHVLFVKRGTLMAQKFDPDKLELSGEPIPIAQNVTTRSGSLAYFTVSDDGELVILVGNAVGSSELVWLDREGNEISKVGEPGFYYAPALSPDGARLAYQVLDRETNQQDIWIRDLQRNVSSKLTFDPGDDITPIWSPDGSRIYYANVTSGTPRIMERPANGSAETRVVIQSAVASTWPECLSKDGKTLYFTRRNDSTKADIWKMNPDDSGSAVPVIATPHEEWDPSISPDGRYLAYASNETGGSELYIRSMMGDNGRWQVSTGGGIRPYWRNGGRELIYYSPAGNVMTVSVGVDKGSLEIGIPKILFNRRRAFDVTEDGSRFIFASPLKERQESRFVVVLNWQQELNER